MARFKRHNKKRHVFGKRKEAAIKAIAKGDVETKKFYIDSQGFPAANPANDNFATMWNIFTSIPKGDTADSENTVIGNQFDCRGVKVWINTQTSLNTEVRFRLTVFSSTFGYTDAPITILGADTNIYEPEVVMPQVYQRFNTQRLHVLESKSWSLKKNFSEQLVDDHFSTMWIPIKGIKTSTAEELGAVTVGALKGVNYFILLEAYIPGEDSPVPWEEVVTNLAWCVYFKDA